MSQNVLITGSSSGFGKLITHTLLKNGHTVIATMRGLDGKNAGAASELTAFAENTSGKLVLVDLDVTQDDSVNNAVDAVLKEVGHVDVLVNNAGLGNGGYSEAFSTQEFQHILEVNVVGVHRVSRAVLPSMRQRGQGLIINISSVMGRIVIPFAGLYTATKYALEGLTESYRYELAAAGIDVTLIEPGGFGTNFLANMIAPKDQERVASYGPLAEVPEKMWSGFGHALNGENAPNPQEVADAVLTLIQTPAGSRPLRTVVDPMTGGQAPTTINQMTDQIQEQMLTGFGMADIVSVKG